VLITATAPLDLESVHGEALVAVLRSARWEPSSELASDRALRFRIRGAAPFEVVTTSPNAVVLANADHDASGGEVPPLIAVGSSLGRVHIADLPAFARQRLEETATIDRIEVRSGRATTLGGLTAHELLADARDIETQRAVRVTHIVATDGERYFLVQAIVDAAEPDLYTAAIERVVASFSPVGED